MLGRKKKDNGPDNVVEEVESRPARPGAKNRPTPKRRDQEAARRKPLVGADKQASKEERAKLRAERAKARERMYAGDEGYLGPRDKGPVRRYLRDVVDARWNIGEFMLPAMLLLLALTFLQQQIPQASLIVLVVVYSLVAAAVIDMVLLWKRSKKEIQRRFKQDPPKGSAWYMTMRSFQLRRSRIPRPAIQRGQKPR